MKFSRQVFEKSLIIKFYKNPSSGARVLYADRQTDMTKVTVAFRKFANRLQKTRETKEEIFQIKCGCKTTMLRFNALDANKSLILYRFSTTVMNLRCISRSLPSSINRPCRIVPYPVLHILSLFIRVTARCDLRLQALFTSPPSSSSEAEYSGRDFQFCASCTDGKTCKMRTWEVSGWNLYSSLSSFPQCNSGVLQGADAPTLKSLPLHQILQLH